MNKNDSYNCDSREVVSALGVLFILAVWVVVAIAGFPKTTGLLATMFVVAIFLPLVLLANKLFKQH